jgi:dipeptidyl aminopeptidase/acylaminoacyl peptidase
LTRLTLGLLLSLCALQALAEAPADRRPVTADDLYRVQSLSEPQVSPDGLWIAYVVTTNEREPDEQRSAIWMVSWDGSQQLRLTSPVNGTDKPRWSPDGRYLAYVSSPAGSDKDQIMLLDRRGGEPRQLTHVDGDIDRYAWSPDSKRLVIVLERDPSRSEASKSDKSPKPYVIDAIHYKEDDGYKEGEPGYLTAGIGRHLYLFDVDSGRLDALTSDPKFNEERPVWSPDGLKIAFTRSHEMGPDQDGQEDIEVIAATAGAAAHTVARIFAPNTQYLAWSPDGKLIAYLQGLEAKYNAYMQDHLMVVPAAGGTPRPLAEKLDRAVTSFAFTADSAMIVAVEDDGSVYPARVVVAADAVTRAIPAGPYVVSALSTANGHTAMLRSDDHTLGEVYALDNGSLRKLTAHNDALVAQWLLGAVEDVRFKNKNGDEIHGLIVKPPSYVKGRKYPTVLWIHGGPNGQDEHSLVFDAYEFEHQMLAAKGMVVLMVNYRGGSGRGIDFAKTIFADWGHKEVEDLLAGVDYLVTQGIADPAHLGIGGWSYGGILTDYTIASDGRFKAAVSGAGSANQISMFGIDQYVLQYNAELGPPWRNTALWLKVSYPFFHADRIHTPTLFLGGDRDFNVPLAGGEQMYEALRTLGVPAELVVYPGQHHIFERPSFIHDLAERIPAWYDRYLENGR